MTETSSASINSPISGSAKTKTSREMNRLKKTEVRSAARMPFWILLFSLAPKF